MNNLTNREGNIITFVIVNFGLGSKVLKEAKGLGVTGGTIFLGNGTVKNGLLKLLGVYEEKKEIVMMVSGADLEDRLHEDLSEKFHLHKPNHGIAFSICLHRVLGIRHSSYECENQTGGENDMDTKYEAIFTIVDRGLAEDVVDAAVAAGAQGGTIVHARGAGIHENSTLFSMAVEPEKEIVLILIEKNKSDEVIKAINEAMKLDEPGKGIMFTIDVSRTSGLFKKDE